MHQLIGIHSVTEKPYKFSAPENFNEFTPDLLLAWAAICLKNLSIKDAQRLACVVFYRISAEKLFMVPECQQEQLFPTLNFLFGKNTLTKWIIKSYEDWTFKTGSIKLHGPDDRLANITIAEFRRTELYYQAYIKLRENGEQRKASSYIDLLIATLYRPKRKGVIDSDIREDITEHAIINRAKRTQLLARKFRHAVLLNYEGCRLFIKENYLDKLPKGNGSSNPALFDFNDIILSVAGGKFGTKAETDKAMLYDFLKHLVDTAEEIERLNSKK